MRETSETTPRETASRREASDERPTAAAAPGQPGQTAETAPAAETKRPQGAPGDTPKAAGSETAGDAATPPAPRRSARKRSVLLGILVLLLAVGSYEGYRWWTVGRFEVSTDDAYLGANMTLLAAKVGGYVTSVDVEENQAVRRGDVIARIDDGDYRLAVQSAKDRIAAQQATIARIGVQAEAAGAKVDEAGAQVASAQADLERTSLEYKRQAKLAESKYASRQAVDNTRTARDKSAADLRAARASLASAKAEIAVLGAERQEAESNLHGLQTALAQAERDLSFTVVRAPVDGVIGNKSVEVGQLLETGTRLAAIVPLDEVYIDANFKETQLKDMHQGQAVEVAVDAYPDRVFEGTVESIAPASGALFSLLPPENATGNFTKIVQRLPVRIQLSDEATREHVLRPGMSVVVTVDTRTTPAGAAGASGPEVAANSR